MKFAVPARALAEAIAGEIAAAALFLDLLDG